jgi:hypothetical protein
MAPRDGREYPKRKTKQELGELTEPSEPLGSATPLTDGHQQKANQQLLLTAQVIF